MGVKIGWLATTGTGNPSTSPAGATNSGTWDDLIFGFPPFIAGVVTYIGQTMVWNVVWTPVVSDPSPTITFPNGAAQDRVQAVPASLQFPVGTLTISATANGVPCDNTLTLVLAHPHAYGTAAWSASAPPTPVCDFVGVPLSGVAQLPVQFTDLSSGGVVSAWSWNFGDAGTSNVQNPLHTYVAAGVYTVSLTATIDGTPIQTTKVAYITVTAPAVVPQTRNLGMTLPVLPISRLINVAVNLSPKAAAAQALSTMLVLGSSNVIDTTERYRVYQSIDAVASDFGTTAPEYLAAVLWFEQVPQPSSLLIGRWAQTASQGSLKGGTLSAASQALANFTAIANGEFTYTKDGGSVQTTSPINLTGALNLPGVAALISAQTSGITFTWNQNFQRFEAVSATTGATSAVSFLGTPGGGTDISGLLGMRSTQSGAYATQGIAAETAINCVALFDLNYGMQWYGLFVIGASDADHLAIAPFINAATNKHVYFVTSQEAGIITPTSTTDIASLLKAANYRRVFTQFSSSNLYAVMSAAARILTTDYTGNSTVITLMYKQEPGIVAESLNNTQADAVDAKNANIFVNYNNNTAIIETGVCADGTFLDVLIGTDWLATTIQTALYNLLYLTPTKIPQTDAGTNLLLNAIEAVCAQGVVNGLLAPGTWTTTGFGTLALGDFLVKGFYVYAPPVAQQNIQDRAARKAVPIQVAAKLAGAVHTIQMAINVNQ